MGVMGDVVKRSFPWQVGKQKQKIKTLTPQQYQLWLVTNEEEEGRIDKILDMGRQQRRTENGEKTEMRD